MVMLGRWICLQQGLQVVLMRLPRLKGCMMHLVNLETHAATSFSQTHAKKKQTKPSTDMRQESTKLLSRYLALVILMW